MHSTLFETVSRVIVRLVTVRQPRSHPLVPNATTVEAMRLARRGELVTVASPDELLADLNEGD
jgi:DNA-damage-inducible protein J